MKMTDDGGRMQCALGMRMRTTTIIIGKKIKNENEYS